MTKFKKLLLAVSCGLAIVIGNGFYLNSALAVDLIVTPVNGLPGQVVQGSVLDNLVYNVHNANTTSTFNITFTNLNQQGVTYTTDCASQAPNSDCELQLTFDSTNQPLGPYNHVYFINGPTSPSKQILNTTIISGGSTISPEAHISTSDASSYGGTFTVTLGSNVFTTVPFGSSTLSPPIAQGSYTASITPAQITVGANTYDAPNPTTVNLAHSGDPVNFVYTLDQSVAVSTDMTMPNDGGATSTVACTGPGSYSHAQAVGTTSYATMKPGTYTCTATNYTGDDAQIYTPTLSNPYTIDATHTTIAITFTAQPPSTVPVSTNLTMPNAPGGTLVACTVHDTGNTYNCSQPVGTAHCDNMVANTDYIFSCANYSVGPDTYSMPTQTNVTVAGPTTTLTGVFTKNAPPGSNYNWNVDHLTALKNANIFSIFWGGGHTTAPIQVSTGPAPNPLLVSDIAAYESSPTTILSSAAVQGFPNYIAMGTVSEPTTTVTDQLKLQHLDITNKYEAPFGNGAGCYYQQQNASGASGGNQKDYWYNANQASGTNPLNWTTTPSPTNLIPAGTYVIAGDQYTYSIPGNFFTNTVDAVKHLFGIKTTAGFIQYIGVIGTPVQVDSTHVTIPETYIALPKNTSQGRPNLANNKTVTFSVPTYVSTNVTFGANPPVSGTSLINLAENMCGSYFYTSGGYTPIVNDIAAQALAVKTATGHNIVAGDVFYTVRGSTSNDGIIDDFVNDYNIQSALYNLATEALLMESQYTTNGVNMVLLLNPDSTNIFQNCAQWYCAISWQKGLTQDTTTTLIEIPNLGQDLNAIVDRLVAYGQLSSGQGTTLKNLFVSSNILAIPSGSGLTAPGMQNFYLAENLLIKQLGPHVPFGYGNNAYDNANPLMAVGTPPVAGAPWETASITWLHKVNHLGYSPTVVSEAIQFEANKIATWFKVMNFADYTGNPYSAYEPDLIDFDRFEDDVIYSEVVQGYLLNGVDWDTYIQYISDINNSGIIKPIPTAMWQMPGSSLQVQGATWPSNALGDDMVDWTFGNPSLKLDFSNIAACTTITPSPATLPCNWYGTDFNGYLNTSVYFTKNSNVNNTIDYLKLTSASP